MKKIKKRITSLLCAAMVLFSGVPAAFAGYENFTAARSYTEKQFSDVDSDDWFYENVKAAYEYGLLDGRSSNAYEPDGSITMAETVKLASCIHSMYTRGTVQFEQSELWYRVYADYALQHGILETEPVDYNASASRSQFSKIFAKALPESALTKINDIEAGVIPDVTSGSDYENAVYVLYRAGVLTGDSRGYFNPNSSIKRSEAAAIVTRMANPLLRKRVVISKPGPDKMSSSAEVQEKCGSAVFKIRTYVRDGTLLGFGSGVLLSSDGKALTCAHVVNGCADAYAEFPDGSKYKIYMYDMNTDYDLAYLKLDGKGFDFLELSEGLTAGDKVFAIGYPGGGGETVTQGQVIDPLNRSRFLKPVIETNVPIYGGNSGGALVDSYGRLAGVASRSESGGSPSFSVPVSEMKRLDQTSFVSMGAYFKDHPPDISRCYTGLYPVPNFGTELGVTCFNATQYYGSYQFFYRLDALNCSPERAELIYYQALNRNTFYLFEGNQYTSSGGYGYAVTIYKMDCKGYPCLCVSVTKQPRAQINGIQGVPGTSLTGIVA